MFTCETYDQESSKRDNDTHKKIWKQLCDKRKLRNCKTQTFSHRINFLILSIFILPLFIDLYVLTLSSFWFFIQKSDFN
jgi:hypothetical protein